MLGTNRRRKVVRRPLAPQDTNNTSRLQSQFSSTLSSSQATKSTNDASKSLQSSKKSSSKSLLITDKDEIDFLVQFLAKQGLQLVEVSSKDEKRKHLLKCSDQATFVKRMTLAMETELNGAEAAKRIVSALAIYLDDDNRLQRALNGTETVKDSDELSRGSVQDSVVRLLLRIRQLQLGVVKALCELLKQGGSKETDNDDEKSGLCSRILAQIKFLDEYFEPEAIANAILDVLKASPDYVQRELVYSLADMVDERFHSLFVQPLLELKDEKPAMTNAVLDAFSNILIDDSILSKVQSSMLDGLSLCSLEDVPPITKFLIQTIIDGEEIDVVHELRSNLRIEANATPMTQMLQRQRSRSGSIIKDVDVMTMHIIASGIQSKVKLGDAFFRVVESVNRPSDHKPLDLLLMLELHAQPKRRRVVESLMRNKIRTGCLNERLVSATWSQHKVLIEKKFDAILELAETFSSAVNEPVLTSFALILYKETFRCLKRYFKQGVVADLVSRIHSDGGAKACALRVLKELVVDLTKDMAQFELFLSSVLNYIDIFNPKEFAQMIDTLGYLAFAKTSRSEGLQETLDILIRKLLSLSNGRSRRFGVLASLVVVKNILLHKSTLDRESNLDVEGQLDESASSSSNSVPILDSNADKMAKGLLHLVFEKTRNSADINALFLDELASTVVDSKVSISEALKTWVFGFVVGRLDTDLIVGEVDFDSVPVECTEYFEKNKGKRGKVVNIGGVIPKKGEGETKQLCRLLSHFCLLQKCAQLGDNKSSSHNILSTVLRASFFLPDREEVLSRFGELSVDKKDFVCTSIFFCVNFLIETINAAVSLSISVRDDEQDEKLKENTLYRLNNLIEIRKELLFVLRRHTQFSPVALTSVSNDEVIAKWSPPEKFKKPGMKKGAKKVGRKRKLEDNPNTQPITQNASFGATMATQAPTVEKDEISTVDLDHYAIFFRELNLTTVVEVMGFNVVATVNNKEGMGAEELCFILDDLLNKLKAVMPSKAPKGFSKKSSTALSSSVVTNDLDAGHILNLMVSKLDILLGHASEILDHFKTVTEENDGIIDSAALFNNSNTQHLSKALFLIFTILKTVLGYAGFSSNDPILKDALRCMARRSNTSINRRSSVDELVTEAIDFLSCSEMLLDVSCASVHMQLLETIAAYSEEDDDYCSNIEVIAETYLKREWRNTEGNKEQGAAFNLQLRSMLKSLLNNTKNPMEKLKTYVCTEMTTVAESNNPSSVYPTLNRSTLSVHSKVFLEFLVKQVKSETSRRDTRYGPNAFLTLWSDVMAILESIVHILEVHPTRAFVGPILRNSRVIIDCFVKNCMPVVDKLFKSDTQQCIQLLKSVQKSTRFLQHVCTHSKFERDALLAKHVPGCKKSLESLVYRVKSTCALHDMLKCMTIGVLRNKKLNGEVILSQSMIESPREAEAEEDNEDEDEQSDTDLQNEEEEEDEVDGPDENCHDVTL